MSKRQNRRKKLRRHSLLEQMEARLPLAGDVGHNFLMPGDVNNDQAVSAGDALAIINMLANQRHDHRAAPEGEAVDATFAAMFYDVNDDGQTSASDALRVINEMASARESHESVEWLVGESGARAKIELEFEGADRAQLEVRLSGAPADKSFALVVGGEVLGEIHTDELGRGELELKYGGTHPEIPTVLATADSSTTVSIGNLVSGTLGSLDDGSEASDGGTDGVSDGSTDGSPDDAVSDGESDASSDAETDASTDVSPDSPKSASLKDSGSQTERMLAFSSSDAISESNDDSLDSLGSDGSSDGNTDGGADSLPDSQSDGSTDGGVDGSSDGSPDDSPDGSSDGSHDASSDGDADGRST